MFIYNINEKIKKLYSFENNFVMLRNIEKKIILEKSDN